MNAVPATTYVGFNGIVDKVRAVRRRDEVSYIEATVHIKMGEEYKGTYGDSVTLDLPVPLPVTTEVNPGDVVSVSFSFTNPFGHRFVGALTVGNEEETEENDDDALEVNVEDGIIAESKEDN
ncbi:MAG: hypothetical protein DRR06_09915 [Gammaproteobacteria bacterium]|nr:MAG: hypothetical protein DRR06_09915 [Gammaproteobacteria bacterium]